MEIILTFEANKDAKNLFFLGFSIRKAVLLKRQFQTKPFHFALIGLFYFQFFVLYQPFLPL